MPAREYNSPAFGNDILPACVRIRFKRDVKSCNHIAGADFCSEWFQMDDHAGRWTSHCLDGIKRGDERSLDHDGFAGVS